MSLYYVHVLNTYKQASSEGCSGLIQLHNDHHHSAGSSVDSLLGIIKLSTILRADLVYLNNTQIFRKPSGNEDILPRGVHKIALKNCE